jgi:tetratricopeptide (TPR) repeat protein
MSPEKLINYIHKPELLNEHSIYDMTLLAEEYPYFQSAQLLRIKNLHNLSPKSIKPALNFTAAYVTDRKVLYYLLHPIKELEKTEAPKSINKDIKDSMVENISETITNQLYYKNNNSDTELEFTASFDIKKEYGEGVELKEYVVRISDDGPELMELIPDNHITEKTHEAEAETVTLNKEDLLAIIRRGISTDTDVDEEKLSETQKRHNQLINNFIAINPKIVPRDQATEIEDVSENSIQENEHYLTDTLAQIYLKQGNYAKAIFAYEKLSLKFPEKSTYFAGQISEIKKILDKTK